MAVNDSATVLEDAAATAITVLTNDTDVDAGPKTIRLGHPAGERHRRDHRRRHRADLPARTRTTATTRRATTPDTFTYTLNGGSTATVSITVTCVNDAPVADDETFNAPTARSATRRWSSTTPTTGRRRRRNPKKTISGDILAGDTDVDGPGPLTVTAGTFATNDGGSVTIEADGDFTFQPAAATSCTDTSDFFDYTVSDQNAWVRGRHPAPTSAG